MGVACESRFYIRAVSSRAEGVLRVAGGDHGMVEGDTRFGFQEAQIVEEKTQRVEGIKKAMCALGVGPLSYLGPTPSRGYKNYVLFSRLSTGTESTNT